MCIIILVIALNLISVNISNHVYALIKEIPPLKQIRNGILPEDVKCSSNLVLIQKISKNTVACVKPDTSLDLIERSWMRIEKEVVFLMEKTEYKIGENVTITMKNMGQKTITVGSIPVGFTIVDKNGYLICTWQGSSEAIGHFAPNRTMTRVWQQGYCPDRGDGGHERGQVPAGTYLVGFTNANPMPFRISGLNFITDAKQNISKAVSMSISPEKTVYKIGEQISITLKNIGTETLVLPDSARGITIRNPDNVGTCCVALAVETTLAPNQSFTYNWTITDWNNTPPKTGNYTILVPFATPLVIDVIQTQEQAHVMKNNLSILITMEKTEFVLGEDIPVKVKNISNTTVGFLNTALGLGLYDANGNDVCCGSGDAVTVLKPDQERAIILHAWEVGTYTVKMWDTSFSKDIIVKNPN